MTITAPFPARALEPAEPAGARTIDAPADRLGQAGAAARTAHLEAPGFVGTKERRRSVSLAVRVGVPVALAATWWWSTATGTVDPTILASPGDVFAAFSELAGAGQLQSFLWASLARVLAGVAIGAPVGLALGLVAGLSRLGDDAIDTTMQMVRAVPFLALVPLFIAWIGIDESFKVLFIACASAAPMYAYTYLGVRNVDRKMIESARSFGLHGTRLTGQVILPTALPGILMALRICLSISLTALIAAEAVNTEQGIGYLVKLAQQYYRIDYMLLCVVLYAVLGLLFDGIVKLLERTLMPWRRHSVVR